MSKRKLTPEQRAERAAAAKQRRADLLKAARAWTGDDIARLQAAGGSIRTVDGGELSPYNRMLVAFQGGAAGVAVSLVGGFRQWSKAGRVVLRGAKAMMICFPRFGAEAGEGSKPDGFGWGYVFDVSQTVVRGEEAPEEAPEEAAVPDRQPVAAPAVPETAAPGGNDVSLDDLFAAIASA